MKPCTWEELTENTRDFAIAELTDGDYLEVFDTVEEVHDALVDALRESALCALTELEMVSMISFIVLDAKERFAHVPDFKVTWYSTPLDCLLYVESAALKEVLPDCLLYMAARK